MRKRYYLLSVHRRVLCTHGPRVSLGSPALEDRIMLHSDDKCLLRDGFSSLLEAGFTSPRPLLPGHEVRGADLQLKTGRWLYAMENRTLVLAIGDYGVFCSLSMGTPCEPILVCPTSVASTELKMPEAGLELASPLGCCRPGEGDDRP
ncbi:uncharacterized protein PADG_08185 [Paracoccidioides brasiliensis Pb18]|uniref:Uncharacterized protein n=1 Tax=Paracoccidioides brasiliensis (strain Pb18) TaxID=502780 RepID=C1GM99_PARBD|nr:uncharacterized protein PADG_08185 [Paracoccidioides brasiliensis Pb18]EEH43565.1 hypothetical protein PADG_08185 [Paracoccidioides brasiliensis Pb18]